MPRGSSSNCSPHLMVRGRCSGAWVRVDLDACALRPEQIVGPLFQAPLFLLTPFRIASQLVAVAFREGRLRPLIPLVATLPLDGPVEAGAGLAIAFPAGSPEIGDGGLTIPADDGGIVNAVSYVVIPAAPTSRQDQGKRHEQA